MKPIIGIANWPKPIARSTDEAFRTPTYACALAGPRKRNDWLSRLIEWLRK